MITIPSYIKKQWTGFSLYRGIWEINLKSFGQITKRTNEFGTHHKQDAISLGGLPTSPAHRELWTGLLLARSK